MGLVDDVTIRPERPGDEDAIRAVNDAAFEGPVEGRIVDDLRGTDRWIEGGSLVAEAADGTIVGHLLLSEGELVAADGSVRRIWMVGPVAVEPAGQRQGIGTALMREAIALAAARRQPLLCLLGTPATTRGSGSSRPGRSGSTRRGPGPIPTGWPSGYPTGTRRCEASPASRRRSPRTDSRCRGRVGVDLPTTLVTGAQVSVEVRENRAGGYETVTHHARMSKRSVLWLVTAPGPARLRRCRVPVRSLEG